MLEFLNKSAKVLWMGIVVVCMYVVFSMLTMHQCHAGPAYTPGDDNYDCRTMGNQTCNDSGSGQGGRYYTPGHYDYGIWQRPL